MFLNWVIFKVFFGCCASMFLMEILMTKFPKSGTFLTFLQYFTISLRGFVYTSKFGTVSPSIPVSDYALLVALSFVSTVANNYVYSLHVPSTLHMIIRSASLPASLVVSWQAKKRAPKLCNSLGSIIVSIGVMLAMYGGSTLVDRESGHFLDWSLGVTILVCTLFTGAFTGLLQEKLYAKYGKHPDEMLFYTNMLPLPFFLAMYSNMETAALEITLGGWFFILLNLISQFHCAHSVHELATKETAVTVTLILTLRRFLSLLISSIVFKNNLTFLHVIGSILVTIGTYIYFDCFKESVTGQRKVK